MGPTPPITTTAGESLNALVKRSECAFHAVRMLDAMHPGKGDRFERLLLEVSGAADAGYADAQTPTIKLDQNDPQAVATELLRLVRLAENLGIEVSVSMGTGEIQITMPPVSPF